MQPDLPVHDHVFLGPAHETNARRVRWVVALTCVTMLAEIAAGAAFGSMALLADGLHMATHAGALGVAAAAYAYAKRHARDPRFSFGTGKVGDLAGFASALVLGVVALAIAAESALRLVAPVEVAFGQATLVAVVGLVVNVASAVLLAGGGDHHHHPHDHDDDHHHHHHHDTNLRAAYLHVLADALTSVLAIIALLAGRNLGWVWLDPAVGIVGAAVIASWAWGLLRVASGVLLDEADPALLEAVRRAVEGPGDARIADLHVWRVGPAAHAAIVSAVVGPRADAAAIRARLTGLPALAHVTVECRAAAQRRHSTGGAPGGPARPAVQPL